MKFTIARFIFFCTLAVLTYCKKNRTPAMKLEELRYYPKTVFVHNGIFYEELPVDNKTFTLDEKILKEHCGSTVGGIWPNSTNNITWIIDGKLKPKNGWPIYESYKCVDSTSNQEDFKSVFTITDLSEWKRIEKLVERKIKGSNLTMQAIKEKFQSYKQAFEMNYAMTSKAKKAALKTSLILISAAAIEFLDKKDEESIETTPKIEKNVTDLTDLLFALRDGRNRLIKNLLIKGDDKDNYPVLKSKIDKAISAYRYLVCTGKADIAARYISQNHMASLIQTREDFRVNETTFMFLAILDYRYNFETEDR